MAEIGRMDFAFELSEFTKTLINEDVAHANELIETANQMLSRWGCELKVEIVEIDA